MRRMIAVTALMGAALALFAPSAQAATTKFTSCDSLSKVYKYGVSMSSSAQTRAVRDGMYKPALKPQVYENSYKTLDRDKDGTMCEVPR